MEIITNIVNKLYTIGGRKLLFASIIGLMIILFIAFALSLQNTSNNLKYGNNGFPTNTITSTPTEILAPPVRFSGFNSGLQLSNLEFKNLNTAQFKTGRYPVYFGRAVSAEYVASLLKLKNTSTNLWENADYQVIPQGRGIVNISNKNSRVNGSISFASATNLFTNFCRDTLDINPDSIEITSNTFPSGFQFFVRQKVEGSFVYNTDNTHQISAFISTSGQLMSVTFTNFLLNIKKQDTYLFTDNPVRTDDSRRIGVFLTDIVSSENLSFISNDLIDVKNTNNGFYFDPVTGYILPIVKMQANVPLLNSTKNYNVDIYLLLVDANYIYFVTPTPTSTPPSGVSPTYSSE